MNARLNILLDSLKLAGAVLAVMFFGFGLQMIVGVKIALVVVVVIAGSIPWLAAWHLSRRNARWRSQAEIAIKELHDEIQRSEYGYGSYEFKPDAEARFFIARFHGREVQQALKIRFAYLDHCADEGEEPEKGSGWRELEAHAVKHVSLLRNAAYWCRQGVGCVNPDLLSLDWKLPSDIHPGGLSALRALSLERKVVSMAEFESLRRPHKRRRGAPAPVVDLTSQAGGDSL
ncbi:MAG: hypothetical protein KC777_24420 [Cyanobacteria bacterium HKST-UBA02]|nr:hypothetical protein [Cyanobacteria bacterium HKST-UBA02]